MKKRFLLPLAALVSAGVACSVQKNMPGAYVKTITNENAYKHLSVLASDEYEGRNTGEKGAEKAAQYIKKQFQSFGLTGPVNGDYFQSLDMKNKVITARNASVNGSALTFGKDFLFGGFAGQQPVTYTDFVFVGYGIKSANYDDLSAANLENKAIIVLMGEPKKGDTYWVSGSTTPMPGSAMRTRLAELRAKKPALIITVDENMGKGSQPVQGSSRPQLIMGKETATMNTISVSPDVANKLLASTGKTVQDLQSQISESGKPATTAFKSSLTMGVQATYTPIDAKNVLGFLEGTDLKNEVLVITAHYDHVGVDPKGDVFNGADDDGSGTTAVIQLAEAFANAKKKGKGPRRSILFMPVVGEEKGLLGSEWYSNNPVFPLANTIANLNIDMIGRVGFEYKGKPDSANYVYVIGSDKLSSTLKTISEQANNTYTKMTLDYKYDDPKDPNRFYYRSDHYNFAKHNIPIIFYFNGVHEDYHKQTDEIKKINFDALTKRTQLVFYTAWDLANRDERPKVDKTNDFPTDR